jgi:hypothetical protein
MSDLWLPPPPPCASIMQAAEALTVRTTPSPTGQRVGSILAGAVVRVDLRDVCLPYGAKWRYTRLISAVGVQVREPLYIALEEVTSTGTVPLLRLVRDECDDVPAPPVEPEEPELPEIPEIPEIPEETFMDWVELEVKKLNVILPFLHDKLGTDQLKALLSPQSVAVMQEVIVGASTPDVDPPPVEPPVEPEPDPETPPPPPPEEWPPVEEEPEVPPVVVPPTARRTTPFEAKGNRIYKNGNLWNKFIGVNHRGLAWYGVGDVLPHSNEGQIAAQLDFDKDLGISVVRFYCAHHKHDVNFAIPRVKRILDMLHERGMVGICVMTDGAHSGFHVPDDPGARGVFGGGNERYSKAWITEKLYRKHYLPYVKTLVSAIANHPAVFTLEICNELTVIDPIANTTYLTAMLEFHQEVTDTLRSISPNSMVSDGAESAHQLFGYGNAYAGFNGARKLSEIVDIRTLHSYQSNDAPNEALGSTREHLQEEFKIAGVPHIWEEINGFTHVPTTDWLDKALHASAHAVVGWMLWNPCWNIKDCGDCDGLNPERDGHNGARKHNYEGWSRAWAKNLRIAT